jgi:hypothetical protein
MVLTRTLSPGFAFAVEKSTGVGFAEATPEFPDMLQV